jgi:hypothetical protein
VNEYKEWIDNDNAKIRREYGKVLSAKTTPYELDIMVSGYNSVLFNIERDIAERQYYISTCVGKCGGNRGHVLYLAKLQTVANRLSFVREIALSRMAEELL